MIWTNNALTLLQVDSLWDKCRYFDQWYDYNRCNDVCATATPLHKWNGTSAFECVAASDITSWDLRFAFDIE